jgi:hypothetical protein
MKMTDGSEVVRPTPFAPEPTPGAPEPVAPEAGAPEVVAEQDAPRVAPFAGGVQSLDARVSALEGEIVELRRLLESTLTMLEKGTGIVVPR